MNAIALSVNVNKIALIRNSREGDNPNLLDYAKRCMDFGAAGITVHPRPDQRHIRPEDCEELALEIKRRQKETPLLEFNIEGNASASAKKATRSDFNDYPGLLKIIEHCLPDQATLVPDSDAQLTSDHGFDLEHDNHDLAAGIKRIKQCGVRVSLFMDPDKEQISRARDIGADRIELYTGPYAQAAANGEADLAQRILEQHLSAAEHAIECGLGINAGHDLNQENLRQYKQLPGLLEVSIGHALTIDSLEDGLEKTIKNYLAVLAR